VSAQILRLVIVIAVLLPGSIPARSAPATPRSAPAVKRPLSHHDYDAWRDIGGPVLSRDGRVLAYSYMPQDGDGEIVIRMLKTGKERRVPVGDIPAPGGNSDDETGGDEPPPVRNVRVAITSDGAFVVATSFPTKAEAERARKEKKTDELGRAGLVIVDPISGATTRIQGVKGMQVPAKGGAWLAYLKEARPGDKEDAKNGDKAGAGKAAPESGQKQPSGAGETSGQGRNRGRRGGGLGTELVLRDLSHGREQSFAHVVEYSFARDGKTLLYTVSSPRKEENGVFAVVPGAASAPLPLLAGHGRYTRLTWDRPQTQAAFLADRDDAQAKQPRLKAYLWQRGSTAAVEAVSQSTPGFPANLVVSGKAGLTFSRNGKTLFVAASPPPRPGKDNEDDKDKDSGKDKENADGADGEPKVKADLWHWKDDIVQPMQRVRAGQERNRTYRGVYHIAEKKYVQLADASLRTATASDDGLHALGFDDQAYRRMVDYDGSYNDVYLIDASSGARKLALKQLRGGANGLQWAPDGKRAFYYHNRHWYVLDGSGQSSPRNLTDKLPVSFSNERHDSPGPAGSYGSAGWFKDSASFLVYDRYDVWQLFVDGRPARNVTEGEGRRSHNELRVERIEPRQRDGDGDGDDDDDVNRGLEPDKPLTLRATNEDTRASGYYRDSLVGTAPPRRLLWGDKRFSYLGRAAEADVLLISAARFDEYPDLHTTDSSFRTLHKVTNGGSQLAAFKWGTGELVNFKNADGIPLQGALYKPANFDPRKKYPLLLYIYERMSQSLHTFRPPRPGTSINISYYVSNGYLVFTPDIIYTVGHPGPSALKCVLPAIQAVVDRGSVDEKAIGIQGHSWGGYQIAYMVTQTNRFRAAAAGAPVGNMTSAYSGIRWGTGQPRQFQYEQTQSRMARLLYEAPLEYLENSPVFHIQNVQTPLLILHNDQDNAVPWYQGIELYLGLRRTGKEAYLWSYNGESHGLTRRHNQKDYSMRMQQFFDHFLKGRPKPEWMEKGIPYIEREEEKERFNEHTGS
jgi:dipeptidyl aminopeptidase/acylaminoacyl peptidase